MRVKFKSERGASAVEFAIVLPVLLLLVFGIIEFSILLYDKAVVTNASREGARVGIVYKVDQNGNWTWIGTQTTIEDTVKSYLEDNLLRRNLLVSLGDPNATHHTDVTPETHPVTGVYSPGGTLTVRVRYRYTFLVIPNFIGSIINPIDLTAQTKMRFE